MGRVGFEPTQHYAADLQSAPFNHSGTDPSVLIISNNMEENNIRIQNWSLFTLEFQMTFSILDHCVQIALTTLHMKKRKRTSASKEVGFFHCGLKKLFEIFSIDQFNSVSSQQSLVLRSRQHIMFWGCHMLHCLKENNYCFLKSLFLIERKIFSHISP